MASLTSSRLDYLSWFFAKRQGRSGRTRGPRPTNTTKRQLRDAYTDAHAHLLAIQAAMKAAIRDPARSELSNPQLAEIYASVMVAMHEEDD